MADMWTWIAAALLIAAFSAALVLVDPLTRISVWWDHRRVRRMTQLGPCDILREVTPEGIRTVTVAPDGEHIWNFQPWDTDEYGRRR